MPAMGPGVNTKQVNRAYEEIMALLAEKYDIRDRPIDDVRPDLSEYFLRNMETAREKANVNLMKALLELFTCQACEDF